MRQFRFAMSGNSGRRFGLRVILGMLAVAATATRAWADPSCRNVAGHYAERAVSSASCPSPVGLCIEGEFSGGIRGGFSSTATSLVPTADTPATGVVQFTGDGVIQARVGTLEGALFFKSAGAYRTIGAGEILDLQVITGGTGDFTRASGVLRAGGTFDPVTGSGESEYAGEVCVP